MSLDPLKETTILTRLENILRSGPEGSDNADLNTSLSDLQLELRKLRHERSFDSLEQVLQSLGTAVGADKGWQTPFSGFGILDFAVEALSAQEDDEPLPKSLRKQALRVVGNSVADNDLNREVVTKHLTSFVPMITEADLSTTTLIVLFNLCNDFDPAKATAATLRLDTTISHALATNVLAPEALDYAVDLLTWTTAKLTDSQLKDTASISSFTSLLTLSLGRDHEYAHEYMALIVHFLQDPDFQDLVCTPDVLDKLLTHLFHFETELSASETAAVFRELAVTKSVDAPPSEDTPVLLLTQLVAAVSGISATNSFANAVTLTTPAIEHARSRIMSPDIQDSPSTIALCVMLGNLAMSDDTCITMVSTWSLHVPLTSFISTTAHSALLFAALGLLRHLAFPAPNRAVLGDAGVIEACGRVLGETRDAAVLGECVAVLGKVVEGTMGNVERILARKNDDGGACLEGLVSRALDTTTPLPSMSLKNPSIESGRCILAILRTLSQSQSQQNTPSPSPNPIDTENLRTRLLSTPHIAHPLTLLLRQHMYPAARADGLLGLGLMAQSTAGAACVLREIKSDKGVLDAIGEIARSGVEGRGGNGRDLRNAMVLLQALGENVDDGDGDEEVGRRIEGLKGELGRMFV